MEDLVALGIHAYQLKEYETAIAYLQHCDKYNWTGLLYLGMSYYLAGQPLKAQDVFLRLSGECPDKSIVAKAQAAFVAVRDKLREDAHNKEEKEEEEYDLEWKSN